MNKLLGRGVDVVDKAGYTALHYAARAGHIKVCQLLINFGASLDAQTRAGLATPLHRAATAGTKIIFDVILYECLIRFVFAGRIDVIKLLLASGANVLLKDGDGQTVLHRAVAGGHTDVAKFLISIDNSMLSVYDNRGRLPKDLMNSHECFSP